MIHPSNPPPTNTPFYRIHSSHELPSIDCSKSVKSVVLSPDALQTFNRWTYGAKYQLAMCLALGCVLTIVFPFVTLEVSRWVSVLGFVCFVVPVSVGFTVMRYDMLRLLVRTYEFWYITCNNVISNALVMFYLADIRSILTISSVLAYETTLLMDANYRSVSSSVAASAFGALSLVIFMTCIAFSVLPETRSFKLMECAGWELDAEDIILNGLGTVLVLLLRNAYRKRTIVSRSNRAGQARVQCLTYRTRVQYRECLDPRLGEHHVAQGDSCRSDASALSSATHDGKDEKPGTREFEFASSHTQTASSVATSSSFDAMTSQMKFVPLRAVFDARNVLIRPLGTWIFRPVPRAARICYQCIGFAGATLNAIPFALPMNHHLKPPFAYAALTCTLLYCVPCCALHNRQMLRHLLVSFDYLFVSFQVAAGHLALAFLFHWAAACVPVLTSWLWMHWILTVDALTPVVKLKLGFQLRFAMLVLFAETFGLVWLLVEIVYRRNWQVLDRKMFVLRVSDRSVVVRAIPFMLTRLVTVFWWHWRLMWRLVTQSDMHGLILLQGAVEYEDYEFQRRCAKKKKKGLTQDAPQRAIQPMPTKK